MAVLQTDLSRSPYFDDYNSDKNFYRILYRPGVPVQTRELNQMQTILQDQIDKFGRHVFKEGSIVEGCAFTFDNNYHYVKIKDTYANGYALTISDFQDKFIYNSNGLKAVVINTVSGFESQAPDLNTLYVKYLNSAVYANGSTQVSFDSNDVLTVTTTSNNVIGSIIAASPASGIGYAFTTTSGVIFKKGFFINVQPQTLIVKKYDNYPDNISVGFETIENIITPESDSSLYDNAAGAPNYSAPGAHRLQIIPRLVARTTSQVANTDSFFSLCDFKSGVPTTIKDDPQYNILGAQLAKRTYETNGNYVVYPFVLSTETKPTSDAKYSTHVNLISSRGLGYVEGYRVEYVNNNKIDLRKSTDFRNANNQTISANYGYYVNVNEYCGEFNIDQIKKVELHDVAKYAVSNTILLTVGYSGSTKIGEAYVRGFAYDSGIIGSGQETYRLYLFDVNMSPGKNFNDVKSIINYDSGVKGVADVILSYNAGLNANVASIQSAALRSMIFPTNQKALKLDGFDNQQYVYRNKANATFSTLTNGIMTISPFGTVKGSATESFYYTGTLSPNETKNFVVIPTTEGVTPAKTGTVQVYSTNGSVDGTTTSFLTNYMIGDYIKVNGESREITFIGNNTYLTVNNPFSSNASSQAHVKSFPVGVPIDFSKTNGSINRSITATGSSATFTLGENLNASFNATTYFDSLRGSTVPISKQIKKNIFVAINCASHSASSNGPWSLGIADVFKVNAIYVHSNVFQANGTNYLNSFKVDNGQRDTHYNLASITNLTAELNANSRIIVDLDAFTYDTSQGVGFFTANSYPVDDTNVANTSAIQTEQIPIFIGSDGTSYDLRDSIDFRPYANNTANTLANSSNWQTSATVNPSSTLTFYVDAGYGSFLPSPDTNFETDFQYYLKRVDRAVIRTSGEFSVIEGAPSENPVAPLEQTGYMTLGLIDVPPYPSLPTNSAKNANRYDYAITLTVSQNKRYTMKDIGVIAKRVDNLEYYTSLSLLEAKAKTTLVRSNITGQNRFQNGILVDPFDGHDIGDTLDPKYRVAIDSNKSELRPAFYVSNRPTVFDSVNSTNVIEKGNAILLPYNHQLYISQPYASKYRNCIEGNIYVWKGEITFDPPAAVNPDLTVAPDIVNNLDMSSNWINLQAAWGTQWGEWQTISTTTVSYSGATSTAYNTSTIK